MRHELRHPVHRVARGNVTETVTSAACARVAARDDGDSTLVLSIASQASGVTLTVSIDLGAAPSADTYSSETVASWSALGTRETSDGGVCVYAAGNTAVPPGSFSLDLAGVGATPHGTLRLVQFVQAAPQVDCGAGDNETVELEF